jgi:hypothetical protein
MKTLSFGFISTHVRLGVDPFPGCVTMSKSLNHSELRPVSQGANSGSHPDSAPSPSVQSTTGNSRLCWPGCHLCAWMNRPLGWFPNMSGPGSRRTRGVEQAMSGSPVAQICIILFWW